MYFYALHDVHCQIVLQAPADSASMLALALVALQRDSTAEVSAPGLRMFVVSPKRESAAQIEGMFKVSVRLVGTVCFFQESSSVESASYFRNILCACFLPCADSCERTVAM